MIDFIFTKEKVVAPGEKIGMILQKHTIDEVPLLRIPYTDYEQLDAEYLFSKIPKIGESNFVFSI